MGTRAIYQCNKCHYSVETSAGFDYGMLAVTETNICTLCKEVVDVCVGIHGKRLLPKECEAKQAELPLEMNFYKCPGCGSDSHLIHWDSKKKPCPKCNGRLKKDTFRKEILWD